MQYESLIERLAANSQPAQVPHPTLGCPCRLWLGNLNNSGYPRFSKRDDHLCVTERCIEPSHLEPVTPTENQRRRIERRRAAKAAQ